MAKLFLPFPLPYLLVAGVDVKIPTRAEGHVGPEITYSYTPPFREARHEKEDS